MFFPANVFCDTIFLLGLNVLLAIDNSTGTRGCWYTLCIWHAAKFSVINLLCDCLNKNQHNLHTNWYSHYCPSLRLHVHCLHWLMSTGLLLQSAFHWPCERPAKWCQWMTLNWWWGPDIAVSKISIYLGLVVTCQPIVGTCGHHNTFINFVIHVIWLCFSSCCLHQPSPAFPTYPYLRWPKVDVLLKNYQTLQNYPTFYLPDWR